MKKILITILLASLLLCGCSAKSTSTSTESYNGAYHSSDSSSLNDYRGEGERAPGSGIEEELAGSKIIKTVSLDIESKFYDDDLAALKKLTEENRGWIENEDSYDNGYNYYSGREKIYVSRRFSRLVLRIPAENLNTFLEGSGSIGNIKSRSISQEDVSENYFDTQSRLDSYTAERDRLIALYDKADTLSEVLELEERITEVNYMIDNYSGTLRHYDSRINYSYVYVELNEVDTYTPVSKGYFERLGETFIVGVEDFVEFLKDLSFFIVGNILWIVLFIAAWVFLAKRKKEKGYILPAISFPRRKRKEKEDSEVKKD